MLEEAVEVMRALWSGDVVSHRGRHYTVDTARIYTLPEEPPKVYVSGFGPKAVDLAARIGDGYITTMPDAEMLQRFRDNGGGDKPAQSGVKVCYAEDEDAGVEIAHRLWANASVPGELAQVLPSPRHFEQVSSLVTKEMTREAIVSGPDPQAHVAAVREYADAGYDEVYVSNMGPHYEGFMRLYRDEVLPAVRS
jgi:G6PDH family F420-dependent oxidoreductase